VDYAELRPGYVRAHYDDLVEVLEHQASVVQSIWEQSNTVAVTAVYDRLRWNRELQPRLFVRNKLTAEDFAAFTAEELSADMDPSELDAFLTENARIGADSLNAATEDALQAAMVAEEPRDAVPHVFELLLGARALVFAASAVTTAVNFGTVTAGRQAGASRKVWRTNSKQSRPAHARMNGEAVDLDGVFSNGMEWPGDPAGGADNNSNCRCSVRIER
jgi:hypothetical protein